VSGVLVWITGLPSAGKSTLAGRVAAALRAEGWPVAVLDGDALRGALVPAPGHDAAGREAFQATLRNLAALLAWQGLAVLVPATAHRRAWREAARTLSPAFVEVHVASPLAACEARDAKGLYAAARAGHVRGLPGLDVAYEPPLAPEVVAAGGDDEAAAADVAGRVRAALAAGAPTSPASPAS
jgi:adenylylsulfate kinase